PTQVDLVHSTISELLVQSCLHADGVRGEEERMHVKPEWHGSVTQLVDAIHRVQTSGHPNLDDPLTEGAHVGDDVDVSGALVGHSVVDVFDGPFGVSDLRTCLLCSRSVTASLERGEGAEVVRAFLLKLLPLSGKLLLCLPLLAQTLALRALGLLLLLLHHPVVRRELQLPDPEPVVLRRDRDVDHRSTLRYALGRLVEPSN